jgi:type IV secretory pathway TraG/TraD family ATPase VirD4
MFRKYENQIRYFARTNFRNEQKTFGIKRTDRRAHMYVIGKTGTGKSTLLETLIRQDIENGEGLALLDPHGDLVEQVLKAVPEERKTDLIYFNVADRANPLGFNPLERVAPEKRSLAAARIPSAMLMVCRSSPTGRRARLAPGLRRLPNFTAARAPLFPGPRKNLPCASPLVP